MEQNPLTQSQSPVQDKKKTYFSILILLVVVLGVAFIVRHFGEYKIRQMKNDIIEQLNDKPQPTEEENVQFSEEFSAKTKANISDSEQNKQDLINKLNK